MQCHGLPNSRDAWQPAELQWWKRVNFSCNHTSGSYTVKSKCCFSEQLGYCSCVSLASHYNHSILSISTEGTEYPFHGN